jgi:hypothetical protein
MRADVKASVDAELERDKQEITNLTSAGKDAINEAKTKTTQELENVRVEVKKEIDKEFQSDNIAALVRNAAKERTEQELQQIIRSEVSAQVAKGIEERGPEIRTIIEDQTKVAVKALEPSMRSLVEKATQDQVKEAVDPVRDQIKSYGEFIQIGNLSTLARGDDRKAFEYLVRVAIGDEPSVTNTDLRRVAEATVTAVIAEKTSSVHFSRHFKEKQTPEAMKKFMTSANPFERETALDEYPDNDKSILPTLIEIIKSDDNLSVLYQAVQRFNHLTGQSFDFWRTHEILEWWDKNRISVE